MRLFITLVIAIFQPALAGDCVEIDRFVKTGSQVSEARPHPCGNVVSQCLTQITETSKLLPTWAYELASDGKILGKWPMPVDGQVWAVSGEHIYVAYPNHEDRINEWNKPKYIKVNASGTISILGEISKSNEVVYECSKLTEAPYLKSAFCVQYTDLKSGKKRIISSEPVCS